MPNKEFKVKHGLIVNGSATVDGGLRSIGAVVGSLPTAVGVTGMIYTVTDATAPVIGSIVTGGGAVFALVVSNGTNWVTTHSASVSGNAGTATILQTTRTIAGVSFNGSSNISLASTNLSDTANIVLTNQANTYSAGAKQTFTTSATNTGINLGTRASAPSIPAMADVFFNTTLGRKGIYDGTQWRYDLYAPLSGTGVMQWDGTIITAATLASTSLSDTSLIVRNNQTNTFTAGSKQIFAANATTAGAAFGGGITADPSSVTAGDFWYRVDLGTFGFRNASAVDALVAGGRNLGTVGYVPYVSSAGVLTAEAAFSYDATIDRLLIGNIKLSGGTEPTANSTNRGTILLTTGGTGVADYLRICVKDASDAYAWIPLF